MLDSSGSLASPEGPALGLSRKDVRACGAMTISCGNNCKLGKKAEWRRQPASVSSVLAGPQQDHSEGMHPQLAPS